MYGYGYAQIKGAYDKRKETKCVVINSQQEADVGHEL